MKAMDVMVRDVVTVSDPSMSRRPVPVKRRSPCADSVVFESAQAPENWTKPSVASVLTSLWPMTHQAKTDAARVPASAQLVSETFKEAGLQTGSFIANGYVSDRFGFRQGWDTYRNYVREGRRNTAQYVAADVLEWLDHRDAQKPFFLYVANNAMKMYGGKLRNDPQAVGKLTDHLAVGVNSAGAIMYQMAALMGWTSLHFLHQLKQPTLIIHGKDDPIVAPANAQTIANRIPNSRLVLVDCGHLFILTLAAEIAVMVDDFLGAPA